VAHQHAQIILPTAWHAMSQTPFVQHAMMDMSMIQQTASVSLALQQQQDTLETILDIQNA